MMSGIIEISGLTKKYGKNIAVDNLNLSIRKGEIFGLLGPNGAGKSTTILMLLGLTEPNSGSVSVCGLNPAKEPIMVKQKVGYLPEDVGFYDDYTGAENLIYTARLNGFSKKEAERRALIYLEKVGLQNEQNKKVGKYSRGMRQRLGLADVLIKDPEVIVLDEPTLGIDPKGVKDFLNLIVELSKKDKITVLFSSHHLHQVQKVCDRVGIFVNGRLLAKGNIDDLANQLFPGNVHVLEGEIALIGKADGFKSKLKKLEKELLAMQGVLKVELKGLQFTIESQRNISAQVSRHIVELGFGISRLNKNSYGLDDIYYKYFQNVEMVEPA